MTPPTCKWCDTRLQAIQYTRPNDQPGACLVCPRCDSHGAK